MSDGGEKGAPPRAMIDLDESIIRPVEPGHRISIRQEITSDVDPDRVAEALDNYLAQRRLINMTQLGDMQETWIDELDADPAVPVEERTVIQQAAPKRLVDEEPPPAPERADKPAVWDLVIADMQERDKIGRARYGTPLRPPLQSTRALATAGVAIQRTSKDDARVAG